MKSIDRSELTDKGEKVLHMFEVSYEVSKKIGKKALATTVGVVGVGTVGLIGVSAYDASAPQELVNTRTIDIGNSPPPEGDISNIRDELIEMGEDPDTLTGAGYEAGSARKEVEEAGTTVATIKIWESPVLNKKRLEIIPKEEK